MIKRLIVSPHSKNFKPNKSIHITKCKAHLLFRGHLEFGFEAGTEFGELIAESLGVLLVALRLGRRMGQPGLNVRRATLLRLESLDPGGNLPGGRETREEKAEKQGNQGGENLRQIRGEFGWNHRGFRFSLAGGAKLGFVRGVARAFPIEA